MTTPSNNTFYEWGYHDPSKDPVLPLSDEQRTILERVISTPDGSVKIGYQLLPSGEGLNDPSKYYSAEVGGVHISAPALYPYDPEQTGLRIDRGNYYYSSGNYTVWPNPEGQDRYSAYWWDVSGIYFSPDIHGSGYYSYPTLPNTDVSAVLLFDELDHEKYWSSGIVALNDEKKYLIWLDSARNIDQFGVFHYGRREIKQIKFNVEYNKRKKRRIYDTEDRKYFYSHFSSADHDVIDKGFEDFQIFYSYIHYTPRLTDAKQLTHEKVVDVKSRPDRLNEIPFLSNTKSVYLYSVYGAGKFSNLKAQDWTSVNFWDDTYSPKGIPSDFHNVLKSPAPPFPKADRGESESEEDQYNTKESLEEKFNTVSGLLEGDGLLGF